MTDIWSGLAIIIAILLLPFCIPIAVYFINREAFRKYGVWLWLGTGIVELILIFLMIPLVI